MSGMVDRLTAVAMTDPSRSRITRGKSMPDRVHARPVLGLLFAGGRSLGAPSFGLGTARGRLIRLRMESTTKG